MIEYQESTPTLRVRELHSSPTRGWHRIASLSLDHNDRTGEVDGFFWSRAQLSIGAILVLQRCPDWEVLVEVVSRKRDTHRHRSCYGFTNRTSVGFLRSNVPAREHEEPLDLEHLKLTLANQGTEHFPTYPANAEGRLRRPARE